MAARSVLVVGGSDETLSRIFADLGLAETREPDGASGEGLAVVFYRGPSDDGILRRLRHDHPNREILLVVSAADADGGQAAARVVGADLILSPPERRRATEVVRNAIERQARQARDRRLIERLQSLDPGLAGEVETLAREANENARALEEAVRLRSSFIANISHEVRTPITVMQGTLEILADDLASTMTPDQVDLLDRVRISGDNLLDLVQGFLDLSKADAGLLERRPTRVYVPDLVADLVRAVEPDLAGKPVRFIHHVPREIEWLTVDAPKLRQILVNLLSNSAKFTAQGEIRLEAALVGGTPEADSATLLRAPVQTGDTLEITVTDTGTGIPAADQQLIFEAFRQVDVSSTRKYEGIGIGLAIVREMATLLGASLHLESRAGEGTTFRLRLPVTTAESAVPPTHRARRSSRQSIRVRDSRGLLPELETLFRSPADTPEDAVSFALDFTDRLLRPEGSLYAERTPLGWRVLDVVGHGRTAIAAGAPPPLSGETFVAIESGQRAIRESRVDDGAPRWSVAAVSREGERPTGLLAVCNLAAAQEPARDDEDLKILQVAARWLALELERGRLSHERAELFSAIGRDVKTALGSLLGQTQTLLRGLCGPLSAEQRPVVLRTERELHRTILSALDLLDYQRASTRGLGADAADFHLEEVVEHVLSRHSAAIELGGFQIARSFPAELPPCRGNEIRTDRSISNLLRALLERLPTGARIDVKANASPTATECEIIAAATDTAPFVECLGGDPLPAQIGDRLGLRIARAGIEAQGGSVGLDVRPESLTLRISLPRAA